MIAMLTNMALNVLLVFPLAHAGLALATSLAAFLNAGLLYRGLRRNGVYRPAPGWGRFWVRVVVANGAMVTVLMTMMPVTAQWQKWEVLSRATHMAILIGAALAAYTLTLLIVGIRPHHLAAGKAVVSR